MNRYLILKMRGKILSFLMEDDRAVEIHCDSEEDSSLLNNIYIGRVRDIAKNIGAAFVEIEPGRVCYLSMDDLSDPIYTKKGSSSKIQQGDELVVQVSRDAIKSKYPSVTTKLTFSGKHVLLITGDPRISASSKLEKEEKHRLIKMAEEISRDSTFQDSSLPIFGWLIRTNASGIEKEDLMKDMVRLFSQFKRLFLNARHRTCYSRLVIQEQPWISRLLSLYDSSADIFLTDDQEIYEEAKSYLEENQPEDLQKLEFYEDPLQSMAAHFSLERELDRALSDNVWLKSGGTLIIEPTEAMTVIDVNSGKYEGGRDREKAQLKVNKEAAVEAARQIRLRNLSGIIVIDFINMENPEYNEELMTLLEGLLKKDPIRTALVDMTKLSLVEITRQKKEKPLHELLKND